MKTFLIGSLLFLSLSVGYVLGWNAGLREPRSTFTATPQPTMQISLSADKLWSVIQNWRQSEGLKPYIKDQRICDMTQTRVEELRDKVYSDFNHQGFTTNQATYCSELSCTKISENITGAISETDALNRWLKSASHAAALREPFKYSCVSTGPDYAVQIFANF